MAISVRRARRDDVPALVRLRLANAERHVELDSDGHRLPAEDAVRRYFETLVDGSAESGVLVLVAEVSGSVAGMTEVVMMPAPPDHQILIPRRTAQVHTIVLERYRGAGIGKALVTAAERHAARRGLSRLIAPILATNTEAVSFYSRSGFGQHGILLSKEPVARDGRTADDTWMPANAHELASGSPMADGARTTPAPLLGRRILGDALWGR